MPTTSRVVIDCWLTLKNSLSGGSDYVFYDFTEYKTNIKRQSSNKTLVYRFYGGNDFVIACAIGDNIVRRIELKPDSGIFTVTYENGNTENSGSKGFRDRTQPFRMHLKPNFYVQRVQQVNISNGAVLHDIVPALVDSAVGLLDTVDGQFYDESSTTAFITNTPT